MFNKLFSVKSTIIILSAVFIFSSCKNNKTIVDKTFTDSLLAHYTLPATVKANETDLQFWKNRIDPKSTGYVNESRYASMLIGRFHFFGDVNDIKSADSMMQKVSAAYNEKEPSPNLSLCNYSILQHRFTDAERYLDKARKDGLKPYESLTASFDVDFEMGRYANSSSYVQQLKSYNDYGYYFRHSKQEHLNGAMDSAIQSMLTAAEKAESSVYLQNVALANAADLYIHNGELKKANDLYMQCIKMNSADYHSVIGLGWIALVHDKNDSLAQQLFEFVHSKNKLPDALFKLYQTSQVKHDSILETSSASAFATNATGTIYGNMYNKYLIEVYTGILHNPARAEIMAANELTNRSTPQTNAWYAWTLFCNDKKDEAYKVFQQSVSGKPLEGLELYWMGKMMQGLGKGYNAQQFFKAAYKNKYDLSPAMAEDLAKAIE